MDAPDVSNRVQTVWEVMIPALTFVCLRGRNEATRNVTGTASMADRFDYDYSDAELGGLGGRVRTWQNASRLPACHSTMTTRTRSSAMQASILVSQIQCFGGRCQNVFAGVRDIR
ncbi:hypothetical protein GCM10027419_52070 [Pandoraea terrae]